MSFSQPGAEHGANGCTSWYRIIMHQYLGRSVARSSERTHASGFRCWCTFCGSTAQDRYLCGRVSGRRLFRCLVLCVKGQSSRIWSKQIAIKYFHRVDPVAIDQECIARYLAIEYIGGNTGTASAPYIVGYVDQATGTDTILGFLG